MKKHFGFTLAEVLITLGIIGVVAALTIPTLIVNYKNKETATKLKKAYSILNQAFRLSEVQNGPSEYWENAYDLGAEGYYTKYWKPFFNGPTLCKTYRECGYSSNKPWIDLKGSQLGSLADMSSTGNTRVSFYTTDGVLFYIFTAVGTADNENTSVYIDLNGAKAPNTLGKDLFFFLRINGRGIYPLGYNVSHDNVNENCSTTCTSAECGKYCAAKIMQDGWEIKY